MTPISETIRLLLDQAGISYRYLTHEPTRTSEDSARVRGEPLRVGGKAILMKANEDFHVFVLSAERKIDSAAIKSHLQVKKLRFATAEELAEQTGLLPGSVPPFGEPVLPYRLFVDPSVLENDRVAFNAGSLTESIILAVEDYRSVARPEIFRFAQPA